MNESERKKAQKIFIERFISGIHLVVMLSTWKESMILHKSVLDQGLIWQILRFLLPFGIGCWRIMMILQIPIDNLKKVVVYLVVLAAEALLIWSILPKNLNYPRIGFTFYIQMYFSCSLTALVISKYVLEGKNPQKQE